MQLHKNIRPMALAAVGTAVLFSAGAASADVFDVTVDPLDYIIEEEDGGRAGPTGRIHTRTGSLGSGALGERGRNSVFPFELPALPAGEVIETANLAFDTATAINPGDINYNVDLYALDILDAGSDGLTADELPTAYAEGPSDPNATLIQDNLLTVATAPETGFASFETDAAGDSALAGFLNSFYAANPGYAGGSFLFLRFTPDVDPGDVNAGYRPTPSENGTGNAAVLSLTTTVIPEPTTLAPLALAVGALIRRRR